MTPSEAAAAAWLAGGLIATAALQAATHGGESVTAGLRAHPRLTGVLVAAFLLHVYQQPKCLTPYDPFRLVGVALKVLGKGEP